MTWTHQQYYRKFHLNVEQYGEILIADVFKGKKMGDAQPCYDIEATEHNVRDQLLAAGTDLEIVDSCLMDLDDGSIRIEVKSKLAYTSSSRANVIHCNENKFTGKTSGRRSFRPATHFAVILFDGEGKGSAFNAWLIRSETAKQLRRYETKSRYIPVPSLTKTVFDKSEGVAVIADLINKAATTPLKPEY
jgi:hypothetical protein